MKKLWTRFLSDTPHLVKWAQLFLVSFAMYNQLVSVNPDLLKIIPNAWEPILSGLSAAVAVVLQFVNRKPDPEVKDIRNGG